MHRTSLRRVGGSVMLAVPPALLADLNLFVGAQVGLEVENGRLVVQPQARPCYTMADLLAVSDDSQPHSPEERAWLDSPATGRELL